MMLRFTYLLRQHWPPFVCFLLFGLLVVGKVLTIPGCLAFDPNDDRNHTFVNLGVAREILRAGEIPQINFYNNFGTPILGDALTYPLALQSLTHYLLPGPLAMTVNRALLTLVTLLVLYVFFQTWLSRTIATLVAIIVFSTPGFLWHFAHHHYQAALLWTGLALLLLRWFGQKRLSARLLLWSLFITEIFLILGVSINVVALALAFILIASLFLGEAQWRRSLIITATSTVAALVATMPQTLSFFKAIANSERLIATFTTGTTYEHYNLIRVVLGLLTQVRAGGGHIEVALYLSLALLASTVAGCWLLLRQGETRRTGVMVLLLGLAPLISVLGLLSLPSLWARLPILKATDITRFWWFSSIFLGLATGSFLTALTTFRLPRRLALIVLVLSFLITSFLLLWRGLCAYGISLVGRCGPPDAVTPIYLWGMSLLVALLAAYLYQQKLHPSETGTHKGFVVAAVVVFALAIAPNPLRVFHLDAPGCAGSHWFALNNQSQFQPPALLNQLEPFHRLATEDLSSHGQDLTASFNYVLGSNGRSIILDHAFADYLFKHKLVTTDDRLSGYHFSRPWQTDQLERLGIRYIIASSSAPELEQAHWRVIATANKFLLYENPRHPTPFYLEDDQNHQLEFIRSYRFRGNTVTITLPPLAGSTTLVATFVERPGWRVNVDGVARNYTVGEDRLIRVTVQPSDRVVRLTYAPYRWWNLLGWLIAGLIVLVVAVSFGKKFF